jgi:hypothetical protein
MFNQLLQHELASTIKSSILDTFSCMGLDISLVSLVRLDGLAFLGLEVELRGSASIIFPCCNIEIACETLDSCRSP